MRLSTIEIRIPNTQQTRNNRDILLQRRLTEMLIHSMSTLQELVEVLVSNVDGNAQSDSRPNTVSSTYPALEAKHVLGVDTELGDFSLVGGECNEVLGDVALSVGLLEEPFFGAVGVGDCLSSGEGLGCDEEESGFRVGVAECFGHVGTIDVGNKVEGLFAVAIEFEGFCNHDRAARGRVSTIFGFPGIAREGKLTDQNHQYQC